MAGAGQMQDPSLPSLSSVSSPGFASPSGGGQQQQADQGQGGGPLQPQATPGFVGSTTGGWGHSLIDTRAYGKLRTFSGKEEDWTTWSFVARSYLDLLSMGFRDLLTDAEAVGQATEIKLIDMTPMARSHAWTLFNVMTQSVEGRALSIIMNAEPSNGLQAWRMLVDAYEPKIGGRYTAMLMGILSPQWGHVKEADCMETLDTWEVQIRRYEEQSKEKITEAIKCAIIMKNAPGGIRTALRTSSSIMGSDYHILKKAIKDYLQTGVEFDGRGLISDAKKIDSGGPAPMDVGAIWNKGGKKGKNDKGKGKKGKNEKGKEGKGVKGKFNSGKSSSSSSSTKFQGYCSYCWKWGHKKAECRHKEKDKKGKGSTNAVEDTGGSGSTNAIQYASLDSASDWDPEEVCRIKQETGKWPRIRYQDDSEGSIQQEEIVTTSRRGMPKAKVQWADTNDESEDEEDEDEESWRDKRWAAAVIDDAKWAGSISANVNHDEFIMFDSGSDEHVCREAFGGRGEEQKSSVRLSAVSGDALAILGERKVVITLAGRKGPVEVEVVFQVSKNAQKNILSSGKLFKQGFKTIMDPEGDSCLWHADANDFIPLYMYGNSFYVKMLNTKTVPMVQHDPRAIVAPVVGDEEDWENVGQEEAEDEIPEREIDDRHIESRMRLTKDSTVEEMRKRLKHLGYIVRGTKNEVWARLKRAEKEEFRRVEIERAKAAEIAMRNQEAIQSGSEVKSPEEPTEDERAKHNLTHLPTASWCIHCTKGKGRDAPHAKTDGERSVVQIDYSYVKADGTFEETTEDPAVVVLTAADRGTGMFTAISLPVKNFEKDYVVKSFKSFVSQLGHIRMTIRSDGEPAILNINHELRDELNKMRGKNASSVAHSEQAPRYSPQSMGVVGSAQRTLRGDFLTLRSAVEENCKMKVTPAMNIWPWMIRHAAWVRGRFGLKANLRTAYEDAFGSQYTGQILPFGEVILFRIPHCIRQEGGWKTAERRPIVGARHFPRQAQRD